MENPFIKASIKKKHLKIYLYGESGVGKTFFALTFPEVAIIDLEGGTDFFSDRFQFCVLDTKSFSAVLDAVNFLEQGKHNFQTLVIDPVTIIWAALQEGRLKFKTSNIDKAISGEEKSFFTYQDWGQLKRFYSLLMTKLVNLPMHIILTSRLKDEYAISGKDVVKIGVKPEAEKSTSSAADIFFRLEVDQGKRVAIFEKDRTGHFDRGTRIENPSYETFRSLIEANNRGPQVSHPSNIDAANLDAEFFQQQEGREKQIEKATNGSGNSIGNNKNITKIITKFNKLFPEQEMLKHYALYLKHKGFDSIEKIDSETLAQQEKIFDACLSDSNYCQQFRDCLLSFE